MNALPIALRASRANARRRFGTGGLVVWLTRVVPARRDTPALRLCGPLLFANALKLLAVVVDDFNGSSHNCDPAHATRGVSLQLGQPADPLTLVIVSISLLIYPHVIPNGAIIVPF